MEQTVLSINDDKMTTRGELIEYPAELIGGRNLLLNSNAFVDNGVTDVVNGVNFRRIGQIWSYYHNTTLPKGTYTFSVLAYNPHNVASQVTVVLGDSNNYIEIQPKEVKLITITITFAREYSGRTYILTSSAYEQIAYSYSKLEKSTIATPWTPSPEDLGLSYPNWVTEFKPSISEDGILAPEFDESGVLSFSINRTTAQEFIENPNL